MKYINKSIQLFLSKEDHKKYKTILIERKKFIRENEIRHPIEHYNKWSKKIWRQIPNSRSVFYISNERDKQNIEKFFKQLDSFNEDIKSLERNAYEEKERVICKPGNILSLRMNRKGNNKFIILKKASRDLYEIMSLDSNGVFFSKWYDIVKFYDLDEISK